MIGYRDGVCIVVCRPRSSKVLVCHRADRPRREGWQFPQGGLHADEDVAEGARRELREEIGTDRVVLVKISERPYCYEVPGGLRKAKRDYSGQCLRWVLAEMNIPESELRFDAGDAEFDDCEWVEPAEALRRIVGFKKRAYREAMCEMGLLAGNEH